jgi:hypothetical protein
MKQTAVDWLIKEYSKYVDDSNVPFSVLEKAKEMEKEQILNTYIEASPKLGDIIKEASERYYNETFNIND